MAWLECEHPIRRDRQAYRLRKVVTSIGRAPGNDLVLDDPDVCGTHASLVRGGGGFTIAPSDRHGVVHVNGRKANRARLEPGDEVRIGGWILKVRDGEPDAPTAEDVASLSTMQQLVRLSVDMMEAPTPERLFETLLEGLVGLTRAEKGFIILFKDGERHLAAAHNVVTTGDGPLDLSRISDSIVDRVVDTLQPLIVSDALHDARFGKAQSVVDLKLSSVMCAPLLHQNDLLGVIYLGNDAITDLFTEQDLTLLRIYASQASLVVYTALMLNQLKLDNEALRARLGQTDGGRILGDSPPMRAVFRILRKVAPTDLSVLVLGETGTGKELVARELHQRSPRGNAPFVAINCGAIPENLLESELFGHVRGAFTGATHTKKGKFHLAHKGSIFLDELGEMPLALQVKLLRVLQERVVTRVGDTRSEPIDIRVIAATNKDLEREVREGSFREDLFYRLNVVALHLPPLRDRDDDVIQIANYLLQKYCEEFGTASKSLSAEAVISMKKYAWPGNIRQLENRLKKAVILADKALLTPEDLDLQPEDLEEITTLQEAKERFQRRYINEVLARNNGNRTKTARDLGVDPRTIFRHLEKETGGY